MFNQILVPLDGTPESNVALPAARTMAQVTGASVFLFQVLESAAATASANETADRLRRVAAELAGSGVRVESAVRPGQPADEILKEVGEQSADLVIMRTRGQAGIQRAVMGSVAERLLSRSDVPIMMLRPGGRRMDRIANLLVPVDGSPGGALALARGLDLAKATGAQIRLVEVIVPLAFHTLAPDGGPMYYDPAWDDEALSAARTYVEGMLTRLRNAGAVANGDARMAPNVAAAIVEASEEHKSDLIIMSTHALTGLPRAVLGSVADAVMRTAPCPVLLLRRKDQAEN
jgi:nucleotide-binding universal stress UspA family protein